MENASKALLIAGAVLFAILMLSLLTYLFTNIQSLKRAQNEKIYQEQLVAFNREYEEYNKGLLYGTDVITVVNKAIQNNLNMENEYNPEDRYYINVCIKTDVDKKYATRITKEDLSKPDSVEKDLTVGELNKIVELNNNGSLPINITFDETNSIKGNANLGAWSNKEDYTFDMNKGIISFFGQDATDTVFDYEGFRYRVYSALTEFKRTVFSCTNISYNDEGRVKQIEFTECQEEKSVS